MTNITPLEQRVMANVGVIYTARKIFNATTLKVYVLALSALALWKLVWVTRIEQNFLQVLNGGVVSVGNYVVYAVVHTQPSVQLVLAVAAVAFGMLVTDLVRKNTSQSTPRLNLA